MAGATVVITTRNRRYELRKAIASALAQSARPDVLVIDDASTDGTAQMVKSEFPEVVLRRFERSQGYIAQRNRAADIAQGPVIFSLDDDAVFSTPDIVDATLRRFDHPRVGAVAIPFVDVTRSNEIHQEAPRADGVFASYAYIGTAHAVRRDLFLEFGRYREDLVHQGEEEDYCTRMLARGYVTRPGTSAPIHHFESLERNWDRMDYYGARNKILYAWYNVPWPHLGLHLAATTVKTLLHNLQPRRFAIRVRGALAGYQFIASRTCRRVPVPSPIYRLSRRLKRFGALPLEEVEPELPEVPSQSVAV
jgi:glycosyltransferase involved in cell wall biosynthesis